MKVGSFVPDVDTLGLVRCRVGEEGEVRRMIAQASASALDVVGDQEVSAAEKGTGSRGRVEQQKSWESERIQHGCD